MAQEDRRNTTADITARMNVSNGYFQNYCKYLLDPGAVEALRHGELKFAIPYLVDYLRANER